MFWGDQLHVVFVKLWLSCRENVTKTHTLPLCSQVVVNHLSSQNNTHFIALFTVADPQLATYTHFIACVRLMPLNGLHVNLTLYFTSQKGIGLDTLATHLNLPAV